MGVEVNEDYLLGGSIVEVLYIFSWKQAVVLGKAVSESDEDDKDYFLVWLIGDEVENFSVKDVKVHKTLIRRCTRKVSRLSFLQSLFDQNLLSDQHSLQEKMSITTEKIVAIRCYCNGKKVVASRCNKLRGNRFIQQKNLVAINPKYCNKQVDAITSLLQQITLWQ